MYWRVAFWANEWCAVHSGCAGHVNFLCVELPVEPRARACHWRTVCVACARRRRRLGIAAVCVCSGRKLRRLEAIRLGPGDVAYPCVRVDLLVSSLLRSGVRAAIMQGTLLWRSQNADPTLS